MNHLWDSFLDSDRISVSRTDPRERALTLKIVEGYQPTPEERKFLRDKSWPSVEIHAEDDERGIIDVYYNGGIFVRDPSGRVKQSLIGK